MNIVVMHGSPRKGNTYQAAHFCLDEMKKLGDFSLKEFFLPNDMPAFCKGCFACILHSEQKCPHAHLMLPIVQAINAADGLIFTTPVYVMHISAAMKSFLEHMAYNYMNHRPRLFTQKALVITTTAGAGTKNVIRYMKENLSFWGINRVYAVGVKMLSIDWEGMKPSNRTKAMQAITQKAKLFYNDIASQKIHTPSMFQVMMFRVSQLLALTYEADNADKMYWQEKGWLDKRCEFYLPNVRIHFFKRITGKLISKAFGLLIK
ncbi:MAG: flavodoxin family protein [Hyphomonadaceae bacterium]|nr:flavodoxin family protein [Clostridia bacterium]